MYRVVKLAVLGFLLFLSLSGCVMSGIYFSLALVAFGMSDFGMVLFMLAPIVLGLISWHLIVLIRR